MHSVILSPGLACDEVFFQHQAAALAAPDRSREMAALMPQATLEIVPGAGHMLTLEQPERVRPLLLRWLHTLQRGDAACAAVPGN